MCDDIVVRRTRKYVVKGKFGKFGGNESAIFGSRLVSFKPSTIFPPPSVENETFLHKADSELQASCARAIQANGRSSFEIAG